MPDLRLPHFLGIGPPKTATTWLHVALGQHPRVFLPAIKETSFFVFEGRPDVRIPGLTIVTSLHAYAGLFAPARPDQRRGEISPLYAVSGRAARRAFELVPDARIIATLRNTVDRAYSEYLMNVRNGIERRAFRTAVDEEPLDDRAFTPSQTHESRILRNGFYAEHLRRYYDHFPAHRIRVCLFEDLVSSPHDSVAALFRWLDLDPGAAAGDAPRNPNPGRVPRSARLHRWLTGPNRLRDAVKDAVPQRLRHAVRDVAVRANMHVPASPLTSSFRRELAARFHDDIVALERLIGRDLAAWREPDAA